MRDWIQHLFPHPIARWLGCGLLDFPFDQGLISNAEAAGARGCRRRKEGDLTVMRTMQFFVLCCWLPLFLVTSADASWKVPKDPQSRAEIVFAQNGKWIVDLACSLNVALFLKYPGKRQSGPATITISDGLKSIAVRGGFTKDDKGFSTDPRDPPFVALWGKRPPYPADLDAVLSILFSGRQLVFMAEGAKYVLPGVDEKAAANYKNAC